MNCLSEDSEVETVTPESCIDVGKLQHKQKFSGFSKLLDISQPRKKRSQRSLAGQCGKGLRHFSVKVCEKVQSKGRTTYNEVADELVAEFTNPNNVIASPYQHQSEDKNIRRRVYDALNVLMAVDVIFKDKKNIQWRGFPSTRVTVQQVKSAKTQLEARISRKASYVRELEEQISGLENLVKRNKSLYENFGQLSAGGITLPFILVQTRPHATVEIEISEDMQVVHFEFNSTPFELHDDAYVLKAMTDRDRKVACYAGAEFDKPQIDLNEPAHSSFTSANTCASPPFLSMCESRCKQERFL